MELSTTPFSEQEKIFKEINGLAKDPIHELMLISLKMSDMMQHINPIFF